MTRITLAAACVLAIAPPAAAQFVVIDQANLAQAILIAERTTREYETLLAQFETIQRMAQGLGDMDRYRIPPIAALRHDPSRWPYGRPWLEGLNAGDADGAAYAETRRRLELPDEALQRLPATARRAVEQTYATVEIADSVAQMGGHQVALVRSPHGVTLWIRIDRALARGELARVSDLPGSYLAHVGKLDGDDRRSPPVQRRELHFAGRTVAVKVYDDSDVAGLEALARHSLR